MKILKTLFILVFALVGALSAPIGVAQEAPDALVKRISQEVLDSAKADKEIQAGNHKRVRELVQAKILPYVDFQHMTALAVSHDWKKATAAQQEQLTSEFRALLVHTYSGAIAQIKDQTLSFKPMRSDPASGSVEVRSEFSQSRGENLQLDYRLEKSANEWKIYDINVMGAWLVETYKTTFTAEISRSGIDGLIKVLADKNKSLAAGPAKT